MKLLMMIVLLSFLVIFRYSLFSNVDSISVGVSALETHRVFPVLCHSAMHQTTTISRIRYAQLAASNSSKESGNTASSTRYAANHGQQPSLDNSSASTTRQLAEDSFWNMFGRHSSAALLVILSQTALTFSIATCALGPTQAHAAPPIAIIAEELGYFPVTNTVGETVYVPKRVQRESSQQAIELAHRLQEKGVAMAGTYWCPHTSRQKELFGKQAWSKIRYVECSPKGYNANAAFCVMRHVDGYPTWLFPGGKQVSGERPLSVLAKEVGMQNFLEELETNVPPLQGSACQ